MEKRSLIYSVYLVTFASNEFDDKNVDGESLEREIQKTRFVFLFFFFFNFHCWSLDIGVFGIVVLWTVFCSQRRHVLTKLR